MDSLTAIRSWLAGLPADARLALRRLRRRPAFSLSAVLIFGLGTGFSTALAGVYQALFLRALPYTDEGRLVAIRSTFLRADGAPQEMVASGFVYQQWREAQSFAAMGAHTPQDVSVLLGDRVERLNAEAVTASLFITLGARAQLGRLPNEEDERQSADVTVLSHEFWTRQMGADSSLLGRALRVDGRPHLVIGVLAPGFTTLFQRSDLYVPLRFAPASPAHSQRRTYAVAARLAPGVQLRQAESELAAIAVRLGAAFPETERNWGVLVRPLREQYFGNRRPVFRLLMAGVALVLLIGCANLAHLSLASAVARRSEFALRSVLGGSGAHLLRQQAAESGWLALGGGVVGLAIATIAIRLLLGIDPDVARLAGSVHLDPALAGFALGVALIASFLGSALPSALATSGFEALRAGTRNTGNTRDRVLRHAMLTGEVALGMVLLLGAAVVVGGLLAAMREDPGFEPTGLVASQIVLPAPRYAEQPARTEFVNRLLDGLRAAPGVTSAAVTMTRFRSQQSMGSLVSGEAAAGDPEVPLSVALRRISPGYLGTTKSRLVAGREFTDADGPQAPKVALISESMAKRYWPGRDAIGRRFKRPPTAPDWITVVGVVGDIRDSGPGFDLGPMILLPYAQNSAVGVAFAPVTVMVRSSAPVSDVGSLIRRTVASLDPDLAIETPLAVEEHQSGALAPQRFQAMLIGAFGATALLLVAAGLYGVTAYGVTQRRREIGIRLALGAVRSGVVGLIVRQALLPVGLGTALGLLASGWVTGVAANLRPTPGGSFLPMILGVAGFLAAVGIVATLVPAIRASALDPAATLKEENA